MKFTREMALDLLDWMCSSRCGSNAEEQQECQDQRFAINMHFDRARSSEERLASEVEANNRLVEIIDRQNKRLQRSYERNRVNEAHMARLERLLTEAGQ